MLFTRCPQCNTVFRITEQSLQKAAGQVRCGRCAQIFDAYAQLGENAESAAAEQTSEHIVLETAAEAVAGAEVELPIRRAAAETTATEPGSAPAVSLEIAADDEARRDRAMSEDEVEAVLDRTAPIEADEGAERAALNEELRWLLEDEPEQPQRSRAWPIAAAAAALLLAGQTMHHFRADLAGQPVIGGPLRTVYGMLGAAIAPRWDVEQYTIVDSGALAQPNSTGHGNLVIQSHIRNDGPQEQPYPYLQLRLLDRWETTVGSRIFAPGEYLVESGADGIMPVGTIAQAELMIVDPGPDAYGFEIDVCIEVEHGFRCAADAVFN